MAFIIATSNMRKRKSHRTDTGLYAAISRAPLKGFKEWSKKMGN